MKWIEISSEPQAWRYETLVEELKLSGFENSYEPELATTENFSEVLVGVLARNDVNEIRVSGELRMLLAGHLPQVPTWIHALKCADSLSRREDTWWPKGIFHDAIMEVVASELKNLDMGSGVFVVGANCDSRMLVGALSRIGFRRFNFSDPDDEKALHLIEDLKKSYFGLQFQFTSKNLVTQLPAVSAVAVNTVSLTKHPEILNELCYLNFLKPDGVWLELQPLPLESPLVIEAQSLGAFTYSGLKMTCRTDAAWTEKCCGVTIDLSRYEARLREVLASGAKSE